MKKKKLSSKIRNFFTFLKRTTKSKKPKERVQRSKKPRTYIYRRLGAFTFWVLFVLMFLLVLINTMSSPSSDTEQQEEVFELNTTTQPAAIQFALDFTKEYFNWDSEDMEERDIRLQAYLASGVESNNINLEGMNWNATFINATLQDINEISANKSHIILSIQATFDREVDGEQESEEIQKYFVVPVGYDGQTLGVYSSPYFTNVESETTVANTGITSDLETVDSENREEEANITNFLPTFFESYASDTQDRLSYVLDDPDATGLDESMNFVEVNSAEVYQGRDENEFIVNSSVKFEEPVSLATFDFDYLMLIQKTDNRYIVASLNAEQVIEELTGYTIETESEVDEEFLEQLEDEENSNEPEPTGDTETIDDDE